MQMVHALTDISQMLYILQLMVSHDVHCISEGCQTMLRSLQAEQQQQQQRPSSVASVLLDDPDNYVMRPPAARVVDYANQWSDV